MHSHSPKRSLPGLAERVKSKRTSAGLSQQVTATRAGMSTNRLRDVERYGLATTDTLVRLARVFEVDVDTLTGRKVGP
jgi:transcriptional regulator with XRE-family HTH domain